MQIDREHVHEGRGEMSVQRRDLTRGDGRLEYSYLVVFEDDPMDVRGYGHPIKLV